MLHTRKQNATSWCKRLKNTGNATDRQKDGQTNMITYIMHVYNIM